VWKLVQHVIPSWTSPEVKQIAFLSVLLIFRTMMSIWLADVNGRIVKAIVEKDFQLFLKRVSRPCLNVLNIIKAALAAKCDDVSLITAFNLMSVL